MIPVFGEPAEGELVQRARARAVGGSGEGYGSGRRPDERRIDEGAEAHVGDVRGEGVEAVEDVSGV